MTYSATNAVTSPITEQVVIEYSGSGSPNVPPTSWLSGSVDNIPRQFWTYSDCQELALALMAWWETLGARILTATSMVSPQPTGRRSGIHSDWARAGSCITTQTSVSLPQSYPASQCGYPTHPYDPWQSIYPSGAWGDGTLVYAGSNVAGKDNYVGAISIPIILPSIRLKLMRDGTQDYEYLHYCRPTDTAA